MEPAASGRVAGLFVGLPREFGATATERAWSSSIAKEPIQGPVLLDTVNFAGDRQADLRVHGGPDKAVCVYPLVHYAAWASEADVSQLAGFGPGAFGENVTVGDLDEGTVCVGDVFTMGRARVEISQPRQPCWKLARRWNHPGLTARTEQTGRTGWYFRVHEPGTVEVGSPLTLEERPFPMWTIAAANHVMGDSSHDLDAAARLAECTALSSSWVRTLRARVARSGVEDRSERRFG